MARRRAFQNLKALPMLVSALKKPPNSKKNMATKKATPKKKNQNDVRHHIKTFWKIFAGFILLIILFFILASWGVFGSLPDAASLEDPEKNLATEIISSEGKTIRKFCKENGTPIPYDPLPDHLVHALLATEDVRFYDHSGIVGRGTIRAV